MLLQHISTLMGTPIAMEPWQKIMHELQTALIHNRFSIWYMTVLLQHISAFVGKSIAIEHWKWKIALTLNSICTWWIFNLVYDSTTSAYIYIYGSTYCNKTLTVHNALNPNSTFTQLIFDSVWDSATAANTCNVGTLTVNNALTLNSTFT